MNKILYIIIIFISLISCDSSKKIIEINYREINEDVFIRLNEGKVVSIDYPIGISLKNVSYKNVLFSSIGYWENDTKSSMGSLLYKKQKDTLISVDRSRYKPINPLDEYILYTQQAIDTNAYTQQIFKKYITKDTIEKKINIGNINNFRKENLDFTNEIIKGDSLHIRIRYKKKIKNIKFPVE